jgi:hypothetical protein
MAIQPLLSLVRSTFANRRRTRRSGESSTFFLSRSSADASNGSSSRGRSNPQARTKVINVSTLGATTACSQRAMTERSRPVRSARSAWVRPARSRASRMSAALCTESSLIRDLIGSYYAYMLHDVLQSRRRSAVDASTNRRANGRSAVVLEQFSTRLPPDLLERLRVAAPQLGLRQSDIAAAAIDGFLKRRGF